MRFLSAVAVASLAVASSVQAQGVPATSQCTGVANDACQQAVDFFRYMAPQLGTAFTGGNTTLAQGGSLGGRTLGLVPKFAVSARVNVVMGNIPTFSPTPGLPASGTATSKSLTTSTGLVPMPGIDVAVGVFKGIPLGVSNVGGVDVLLSATYLPKINNTDITITPDKPLSIGYGLRVGLLQESLVAPGIGFSFLSRKLPMTTLSTSTTGASMTVNDLDLSSFAWRLTVSKSLLLFGIAAGVGQDKYDASTQISATSCVASVNTPALTSEATRTNYFADISMNLFVMKLVGTIGMVSGGDIKTFNSYDNPADKSRVYGSVGVRFGL